MVSAPTGYLQLELERHIQARTGRRIRDLSVDLHAERVVLTGHADTYYVKQLAQHGVRDLLPHVRLENAIEVGHRSD
jgi:DNA-binding NarL/FixJ family response regulator